MKLITAVLAAILVIFGLAVADATGAFGATTPSSHATYALGTAKHCRTSFVKRTERRVETKRVKVHGKWRTVDVTRRVKMHGKWGTEKVMQRYVACVYVAPVTIPSPTGTTTIVTTSPVTVTYAAKVDPTFTQSPTNPLAVTYDYSADAISTQGSVQTDLGATGQLPAGILDLYSNGLLTCSMNVGAAVVGGNCAQTYAATGTQTVITEYIPNGQSAVSQTETETIKPYSTTTTIALGVWDGPQSATVSVLDQNGNALVGNVSYSIVNTADGISTPLPSAFDTTTGVCFQIVAPQGQQLAELCNDTSNSITELPASGPFVLVATYAGTPGWTGSQSAESAPLTVPQGY